jgi:hypothetical protein
VPDGFTRTQLRSAFGREFDGVVVEQEEIDFSVLDKVKFVYAL